MKTNQGCGIHLTIVSKQLGYRMRNLRMNQNMSFQKEHVLAQDYRN